jgi:putative spermidine/putrescine transport system permease protein
VLFLYGPMITIFVLSFQGPEGGLTFPMRGVSLHWFAKLAEGMGVVDIGAALRRSLALGAVVMALTVLLSVLAGWRFARSSRGNAAVLRGGGQPDHAVDHCVAGHRAAVPLIDNGLKAVLEALGMTSCWRPTARSLGLYRRPWART